MSLVSHDSMDAWHFVQAPCNRHDAGDRYLSCEIISRCVDGRELDSGPHEVELFNSLSQQLVQYEPFIFRPTQA